MDLRTLYKNVVEGGKQASQPDSLGGALYHPDEAHAEVDLFAGDYVTSETCILFGGPPLMSHAIANPELVKQVGLCFNFSITSNKMHMPWQELNIKDEGAVPGRIKHNVNASRILSNHNSALYSFYRWLTLLLLAKKNKVNSGEPVFATLSNTPGGSNRAFKFEENPGYFTLKSSQAGGRNDKNLYLNNRSAKQYNAVSSEFFNAPTGIFMLEMDSLSNIVAALYLENCKVAGYSKSYGEAPTVTENLQFIAKRIIPAHGDLISSFQTDAHEAMVEYKPFIEANKSANAPGANLTDSNAIGSSNAGLA